jgi:hypothetical protein
MPDGPWAQKRARKRNNKPLASGTLYEHAMIVKRHIIPELGQKRIGEVDMQMVDDWLYSLDVGNSMRRNIASTMRLVLKEAVRRRIIQALPLIELPAKGGRKPSTLTPSELALLFPADLGQLRHVWAEQRDQGEEGLALAACSACMFLAGMRPQEVRAAAPWQLQKDIWAILVTQSMDGSGKVQSYVKMADARDPRYRGTFLFLQGPVIMQHWLAVRPESDFLFSFRGGPILKDRLQDRLRAAIRRAGISMEGRTFIPYSGRYTFETVVKPVLSRDMMMMLMGHIDPAMPEHYDVPVLADRMRGIAGVRAEVNAKLLPARAAVEGIL